MKSDGITGWVGLVVFVCVVVIAGLALGDMANKNRDEGLAIQKRAIERAAVMCYALEGSYPPQTDYLEEKYGLIVDRSRFIVSYVAFGSNVKPEIAVYHAFE